MKLVSNAPRVLDLARDVVADPALLEAPQPWIVNGSRGMRHSPVAGSPRQSKCRDFAARDSYTIEEVTFEQVLAGRYCDSCVARQIVITAADGLRAVEPLMNVNAEVRKLRSDAAADDDVMGRWLTVESIRRVLAELERLSLYEMAPRSKAFLDAAAAEMAAVKDSLLASIAADWQGVHESSVMASMTELHKAPSWLVTPSELLVLNDNEPHWMSDRGVPSAYREWIAGVQSNTPREERRRNTVALLLERNVTDVRQLASIDPRVLAQALLEVADQGDVEPTLVAIGQVWRSKLATVADQIVSRWELLRDELLKQDDPAYVAMSLRPEDSERLMAMVSDVFKVAAVDAPEGYWSRYVRVVVRVPESTASRLLELSDGGSHYRRSLVEKLDGPVSAVVAETALALWEPWESTGTFTSFASALASAKALVEPDPVASESPSPADAQDTAAARRVSVAVPTSSHAVSRFV